MDMVLGVIHSHGSRQSGNSTLRGSIRSNSLYTHKASDRRYIDDPPTVSARMQVLLDHLKACILAAEEDTLGVNQHGLVVHVFGGLVNGWHDVGAVSGGDSSIVDHTV